MNIEYYISPYQILEEKLRPGIRVVGSNVSVTVAGTTNWYRLPVVPLFPEIPQEGGSIHGFSSLTDESSMSLPACFFFRFDNPEPILLSLIQKIQTITGLPVISTKQCPLHELVIEMKHKCLKDCVAQEVQFVVSLPGCKDHCYVMNSTMDNEHAVMGALVNKIPFIHPSHVPSILEILRHQAAYNTLLNSCISDTINPTDHTSILHFEVSLQRDFRICISFQHPNGGSLSCVVVDIMNYGKLICSLYTSSSDPPSPCSNEFVQKVLESCMSVPLIMRTIFKKAQQVVVSEDLNMHSTNGNNEYQEETVTEPQHNMPQDMPSNFGKNNDDHDHNEDMFLHDDDGGEHSVDLHDPKPSPTQEPDSSYTEQPHFHPVEMNSSVAEESYSSTAEEQSSSLVQELSPIIAEVPSPNVAEDQSSSSTEELSSSITEELGLSISELAMSQSMLENGMNE